MRESPFLSLLLDGQRQFAQLLLEELLLRGPRLPTGLEYINCQSPSSAEQQSGFVCYGGDSASHCEWSVLRCIAKRRYAAHFVSKLTDCDGENSETDSSLDFAKDCHYITIDQHTEMVSLCKEVAPTWPGFARSSR